MFHLLSIKKMELKTYNDSWMGGININNYNDKYTYLSIILINDTYSLDTHNSKLLSNVIEFINKYKEFIKLNVEQYLPEKSLGNIIVNYILQ